MTGAKQWILAIGLCIAIGPATASASTIATGFDLFMTDAGATVFGGVPFEGLLLNTFDFGDGNGAVDVGPTDTIVERLTIGNCLFPPCTDTIDIEIVALSLVSVAPVDFGAGLGLHYVTLQNVPNLGTLDIIFDDDDGGTSDSTLNINFDLRIGSPVGTIIFSDSLNLTSNGVQWGRVAPPNAVLINGVNRNLNGVDIAEDFWRGVEPLTGNSTGCQPHGEAGSFPAIHCITAAPEPGTGLLFAGGLIGLGIWSGRGRKRRA